MFEEGWGEIDHAVVYPYYQNDKILKEYTELLNRLSGLADEMSSFFYRLKNLEIKALKHSLQNNDEKVGAEETEILQAVNKKEEKVSGNEEKSLDTPYDCLQSVLDE